MRIDLRAGAASLGFGILGSGINGLLLYAVTNLFKVYPLPDMGISLPTGMASGLVCYFLAYHLYARSGYLQGWFFGALAGAISGAVTGIGYLLSYDQVPHVTMEFVGNAIAGAMVGGLIGMMAGFFLGPLLARITGSGE
ncbi:MAG: hypothetical protein ISS55_10540 [Dehalococcoidales bacterium]|nr:hypothetical protein [Dehalococcoidales bacterium]